MLVGFKKRIPFLKPSVLISLPRVPPPSDGEPGKLLGQGHTADGYTGTGAGNQLPQHQAPALEKTSSQEEL